jgi:hypothetical protein
LRIIARFEEGHPVRALPDLTVPQKASGEHMDHPITTGDEGFERDKNRHRGDEQRNARVEATARLRDRGIDVDDAESVDTVVDVLEAVEAFERAVEARGGDLMVDTPPSTQPDDPHNVLPRQHGGESLDDYAMRVRGAARDLAQGRTRDD